MLCQQPPPAEKAAIAPAAVLQAFGPAWLDADRCRDWLLRRLHPRGPACPDCGCPAVEGAKRAAFYAGKRIKCSSCARSYSATTGTILENAKLQPFQFVLLSLCLALDIPTSTTATLCCVNARSVHFWRKRLETSA